MPRVNLPTAGRPQEPSDCGRGGRVKLGHQDTW